MTVYELIQRLAQYDSDQQVRFRLTTGAIHGIKEYVDNAYFDCYDIRYDGGYPSNVEIVLDQ